MRPIGLSIENISTDASSNIWWASKEGSHDTLTPPGRFCEFVGRDEGIDDTGYEILLVLRKS